MDPKQRALLKGFCRVKNYTVPNIPMEELTAEKRCLHCLVEWISGMYETYDELQKNKAAFGKHLPNRNIFERKCLFCNNISIILAPNNQIVERAKKPNKPKHWHLKFVNVRGEPSAQKVYTPLASQESRPESEMINPLESKNHAENSGSACSAEPCMKEKTAAERLLEALMVTKPDEEESNEQNIENILPTEEMNGTATQEASLVNDNSQPNNINESSVNLEDSESIDQEKEIAQQTVTKEENSYVAKKTKRNYFNKKIKMKIEDEFFLRTNLEAKQVEIALIVQETKSYIPQSFVEYEKPQTNDFQTQENDTNSEDKNKVEPVQQDELNMENANESNIISNSSSLIHDPETQKNDTNTKIDTKDKMESEQIGLGVPKSRKRKNRKFPNKKNVTNQESEINHMENGEIKDEQPDKEEAADEWFLGNNTVKIGNNSRNLSDTKDMLNRVAGACGAMSLNIDDVKKEYSSI